MAFRAIRKLINPHMSYKYMKFLNCAWQSAMISIALSGCAFIYGQHPLQENVRKALQLNDDCIGKGPAGILKRKVKKEQLNLAKTSFFDNQYGLGICLDWDTTLLCIVLKERIPTPFSPLALMNNIPGILIDGDKSIEKSINESWVIVSWKLIDIPKK
jgi:hypothetical protein